MESVWTFVLPVEKDRSAGCGARVERGLPGVRASLETRTRGG